jgi:hypothetical protein
MVNQLSSVISLLILGCSAGPELGGRPVPLVHTGAGYFVNAEVDGSAVVLCLSTGLSGFVLPESFDRVGGVSGRENVAERVSALDARYGDLPFRPAGA